LIRIGNTGGAAGLIERARHGLSMTIRIQHAFYLALALAAAVPGHASAQGYPGYPDTIMAPEPGTASHRHASAAASPPSQNSPHASLLGHEQFVDKLHRRPGVFVATRGSSGSVLPTALPRTGLIPPEGRATLTPPVLPQEQGPTMVPGLARSIPNLSHGPETFQDRASRCSFQSSLYGVPGGVRTQYMGACLQ
jgi:hypothetical protein